MLTGTEWTTLGYLLAVGLTIGGVFAVLVFLGACALFGLNDTSPDSDFDDLQQEIAAWHTWRDQHGDPALTDRLHPTLRESGYYGTPTHQARAEKVDRAMGGSDAA
ncbi:MAG: hypothetical protein IPO08_21665 [Xanthomonadales bacterium]|nr:hypothetical protein [Xanthomonadales bacterium]